MRLIRSRRRLAVATVAASLMTILASGAVAHAVSRTCGPDAVANTADVLCAPPSGPCTPTRVTVDAPIEVASGGCQFDLEGRAVVFQRVLEVAGPGFIKVVNAGAITITPSGALKARGDFVRPNGFIVAGGLISLTSSDAIVHDGLLDVSGDAAGVIRLAAAGDVTVRNGAAIVGNGISTFTDEGARYADGGDLEIVSATGSIQVNGPLVFTGANQAIGGFVSLIAARDVILDQLLDVSGGGGDGGDVDIVAGDQIVLTRAINADSRIGGGYGGSLQLDAGSFGPPPTTPGGSVRLDNATVSLQGSAGEIFGGDGGDLDIVALGDVRLVGGTVIRADAATSFDGFGGWVSIDSSDFETRIGPLDGDLEVSGIVSAHGGSSGGDGGLIDFTAGRDATITADVDASGSRGGGDVFVDAGRALVINGTLTCRALDPNGDPGTVELTAGKSTDEDGLGHLTIRKNILADGGADSRARGGIALAGCGLVVERDVKIDGHAGSSPGGIPGGSDIDLESLRPMQLGKNSQFLAGPGGTITTHHPPGAAAVIATGVLFDPPRFDGGLEGLIRGCAVCGDGVLQPGEACDPGAPDAAACCSADCSEVLCALPTPQPTPESHCPEGEDADGDTVCDSADNCVDVANPDQADIDADGLGDACDDADAALEVRRARVRRGDGVGGQILVKGELPVGPPADFHATRGFQVQVAGAPALDLTVTFASGQCVSGPSGRITCRSADGRMKAVFTPRLNAPDRLRLALRLATPIIEGAFAPTLLLRITDGPASGGRAIDRAAVLSGCQVTDRALLCVAGR